MDGWGGVVAGTPPTAEDWALLYERLTGIARHCRQLPEGERRGFLAASAPEACGLDLERIALGGPFQGRTTQLETYSAEFFAHLLRGLAEGPPAGLPAEARIRSDFLGFHPKIADLRRAIVCYLESRLPILLVGDRGTGKGALARASARTLNGSALLTVSMAGVPDSLAESELFGHEKGAFTDAIRDRRGIFRTASGTNGLVYLDDVAECSSGLQAKLLTALEEGVIRPLGSDTEFEIGSGMDRGFRLLSSCQPASLGKLRPDLRDRLSALPVWIPPLRERGPDILLLADRAAGLMRDRLGVEPRVFSRTASVALLEYAWPGNVRQLFNVVGRTIVRFGDRVTIDGQRVRMVLDEEELLADHGNAASGKDALDFGEDGWPTLAEMEERYIARVLETTGGNISQAARILGIHRTTLQRRRNTEGR